MAPLGEKDTLMMTMDELLVPSTVEPQLVATRHIELGVFFSTFVSRRPPS